MTRGIFKALCMSRSTYRCMHICVYDHVLVLYACFASICVYRCITTIQGSCMHYGISILTQIINCTPQGSVYACIHGRIPKYTKLFSVFLWDACKMGAYPCTHKLSPLLHMGTCMYWGMPIHTNYPLYTLLVHACIRAYRCTHKQVNTSYTLYSLGVHACMHTHTQS